jgi:hypothetical protein
MSNMDGGQKSFACHKRWSWKDICDLRRYPKEIRKQTNGCKSVERGEKCSRQIRKCKDTKS